MSKGKTSSLMIENYGKRKSRKNHQNLQRCQMGSYPVYNNSHLHRATVLNRDDDLAICYHSSSYRKVRHMQVLSAIVHRCGQALS